MLSKCANPGCPALFLYLHQGKLFRLDTSVEIAAGTSGPGTTKRPQRVEFFWLCNECAAELTIGYKKGFGITVLPLSKEIGRAQTA